MQDFTGIMFKKKDYMFVLENVSWNLWLVFNKPYVLCIVLSLSHHNGTPKAWEFDHLFPFVIFNLNMFLRLQLDFKILRSEYYKEF